MQNDSYTRTTQTHSHTPRRLKEPPRRRRRRRRPGRWIPVVLVLAVIVGLGWAGWHVFSSFMGRLSARFTEPAHPAYNEYDSSGFSTEGELVTYTDDAYTTLQGIDVSSHQGEIDWQAASEGLDFVIVRAGWRGYTEGDIKTDDLCLTNLQEARENGLQVGVYFFSQAITPEEAKEEAETVLTVLDGFALDLPVYYDWELTEEEGARTEGLDYDTLTECAKTFCSTIEEAGYDAGIYFYRALGENEYDLLRLEDYSFWLSNPGTEPDFLYTFSMWQYSKEGTVNGIDYPVDRDLLILSAAAEEEP